MVSVLICMYILTISAYAENDNQYVINNSNNVEIESINY